MLRLFIEPGQDQDASIQYMHLESGAAARVGSETDIAMKDVAMKDITRRSGNLTSRSPFDRV